jgi:hypothetical protein
MIGRGSRKLPNKDMFTVIDLGNNAAIWFGGACNWQHIFKSPEFYLENLRDDTEEVFQVFHAFRFAFQ